MSDISLEKELDEILKNFLDKESKRFPADETLTIDLHCHDHNSDEPDELMGRILNVPETWLSTEDLMTTLKRHGCDVFTVTNHNNARSCFELREKGIDVLTGAEFSCMVPDFKTGIHVLTYGFNEVQEKKLEKLRHDIYKFQEYTKEHNIPTIWAHPLFHYKSDGIPPMDFFEKMSLVFERFEVINGQRDTWQNMLVKEWVETLDVERLAQYEKKYKIRGDQYCTRRYDKAVSGGSDSHMGVFTGLTGTKLHVPNLAALKDTPRSLLALEALRDLRISPYGSKNDSEKMTVTFIDYLCQIALNMKDPGLIRMILHKGDAKQKMLAFGLANMFSELKRHRVTISFLKLFHECFTGKVPGYSKRLFIPKHYKPVFDEAAKMALVRRDDPAELVSTSKRALHNIYESLITLFVSRLTAKLTKIFSEGNINEFDINKIVDSLEVPVSLRSYMDAANNKKKKKGGINLSDFLDGLSFPFLASSVILAAAYTSARVLYNSRPLLKNFSEQLGRMRHPERILWLTDTFEDVNGVAMVLNSMLDEIRARNLPIDIMVCSSKLESAENLIVVKPLSEFTFPFYEHQPMRIPNILEIHRIFKENEYSKIICSTEGPMGLISLFLKKAYSVPAYFFVHTDWMMFARQVLNFDHHNRSRMRRILRAYYRAYDGLFVLNTDQRKWLTGSSMGFDPSRVFLTAHWADKEFVPHKTSKNKIFGVSEDTPVLLFAGRISEEKGVLEIPAIIERVKTEFPDVRVAFAGKGPADEALRKALPEGIYLGWVDHKKLPEIYSAADMLLLPSKFDTFGCVVLEALSCSLPVTAYETKGPKDIIEQGKNGFLVKTKNEMADVIIGFLKEKNSVKEFKKQAVERSRAYTSDVILKQFLKDLDFEHAWN